jgi:hypothetical protein
MTQIEPRLGCQIFGNGYKVSDGIPKLRFGLLNHHLQLNRYQIFKNLGLGVT